MKPLTCYRWVWIISLFTIGLMSPMGKNYFLLPVAAQGEPTRVPTATAAPTWTPVPGATSTPTLMPGQTPAPTKTPSGRDVDLRPGDDTIEIEAAGNCVQQTNQDFQTHMASTLENDDPSGKLRLSRFQEPPFFNRYFTDGACNITTGSMDISDANTVCQWRRPAQF